MANYLCYCKHKMLLMILMKTLPLKYKQVVFYFYFLTNICINSISAGSNFIIHQQNTEPHVDQHC